MPRGGARNGAGRKRGTPNRATRAAIEGVAASGLSTPLMYALQVLNDTAATPERRDRMAALLLPYLHHRLTGAGSVPSPEYCSFRGDEAIEDEALDFVERLFKRVKE